MLVSSRRSAALRSFALTVVLVVLLMALHHVSAVDDELPCSAKALYPCLASARGPYPPVPDAKCCTAVKEADSACLCKQFDRTKLSDNVVNNVLALPKACGRVQLSGTRCGSKQIFSAPVR